MKKLILLIMCLLLSTLAHASWTNVSLPTIYNSIAKGSIIPTVTENPTFLQVGEDDPGGLGFSTFSSFFITMNTTSIQNITANQMWANINVNSLGPDGAGSGSFRMVNTSNASNDHYVTGMDSFELNAITTSVDYVTSHFFSGGLHTIDLGAGALNNLTAQKDTGFFSVGVKDTSNAPSNNEYWSYINSTNTSWQSHFFVDYDCQAPENGDWNIYTLCNINSEYQPYVGHIIVHDGGILNITGNSTVESVCENQKIKIKSGGRITLSSGTTLK